jgi:hypothetical protein
MSRHIALLGDSIFDNRAYTGGDPDVVTHLRAMLPAQWRATLCAVDGATTGGIHGQLGKVPRDASHVVISVGGNDALMNRDLLDRPVTSTRATLALFGARVAQFESAYRAAIDAARALGRTTAICTIYNGNLEPDEAGVARVALMTFNDVILRAGFERRLAVIDLRLVVTEPADYANPIEPSGTGGRKIAAAIARATGAIGDQAGHARVFGSWGP